MALYGVLGDVLGNQEALTAALLALDARGAQGILCVGGVVGYNADPDACVGLLRARDAFAVAGASDRIGIGQLGFERCSNRTRFALERTRRHLSATSMAWLEVQPPLRFVEGGIALVHGAVGDVHGYMRRAPHIAANARRLREELPQARLCFFGHTLEQKAYVAEPRVEEMPVPSGRCALPRDALCFVNPGGIDGQRRREPRFAQCALFDSDRWEIEFLRVPYDAMAAEAKAVARGYRIGRLTDMAYTLRRRARRLIAAPLLRARHGSTKNSDERSPGPRGDR
ncbi:MAG TPA: hypothetical protein VEB23_16230 [Ramlibacter sp.]|nr:hypothetical protein [Ramlibacter sp.]